MTLPEMIYNSLKFHEVYSVCFMVHLFSSLLHLMEARRRRDSSLNCVDHETPLRSSLAPI